MPLANLDDLEAEWAIFMQDRPGGRNKWTQDQRWRADNPGELQALLAYRNGGARPIAIMSQTGKRMLEHLDAYREAKAGGGGTTTIYPSNTRYPAEAI